MSLLQVDLVIPCQVLPKTTLFATCMLSCQALGESSKDNGFHLWTVGGCRTEINGKKCVVTFAKGAKQQAGPAQPAAAPSQGPVGRVRWPPLLTVHLACAGTAGLQIVPSWLRHLHRCPMHSFPSALPGGPAWPLGNCCTRVDRGQAMEGELPDLACRRILPLQGGERQGVDVSLLLWLAGRRWCPFRAAGARTSGAGVAAGAWGTSARARPSSGRSSSSSSQQARRARWGGAPGRGWEAPSCRPAWFPQAP